MLLSERFKLLNDDLCHTDFTAHELLEKLGDKSHCLATIILSLPFLFPIPVPGLSTVMGLMISWVAYYWLLKKTIWVPHKWHQKTLPATVFSKVFTHGEKYAKKFEFLFKARGEIVVHALFTRTVVFTLILLSALFLALPLPPGTNFPPAITIIVLALSILFEDILLVILGVLVFTVNTVVMYMAVKFMWAQSLPYIESFFR